MAREPSTRSIAAAARDAFGFSRLRPGQHEAIAALLEGRDVVVVMPTGSGKSAIYQVAGILLEGPTVVVSPLIALQRDQLDAIEDADAPAAAALNSTLRVRERRDALEALARDRLEFVLLAPEQLANEDVLARLRDSRPSLFVVDEAHCISEWGHDFRPDYLRLGAVVEELGRPTVLAMTATASPPVRAEIAERLGLADPLYVVRGFDRPNIHLAVRTFGDDAEKRDALVDAVVAADKPGLVYAATRARAEETAAALAARGVAARAYHGGMRKGDRDDAQTEFMDDELEVIVATTAFGMGIDKPNVRFVFHLDVADSVDSYYQEIGRAGRDGEAAHAVLFFRAEDLGLRRFFAGTGTVDAEAVADVAEAVQDADGPTATAELREETGLSRAKIASAVTALEDAGALDVLATGEVVATSDDAGADPVAAAAAADERRRSFERSRVEMMRAYAELRDCRRGYLLNYFGEEFEPPCGNCDACDAGIAAPPEAEPFPLGARVRHDAWGEGTIQRYEADKVFVLFDDEGYKTLDVSLVVERDLLAAAERGNP